MSSNQNENKKPYAVVIGLDHMNGIQTARILARHDVPVIAIAKDPKHYCCRTNVCERIVFTDTATDTLITTLETMGPELEEKAVTAGISDNTEFTGKTSEVKAHLSSFDVFAGSSIREGLPLAVLEAMAASLPVVTTDVGGNREAVIDGETGILVPAGDHYALADALEGLYRDREKRVSMGRAGRARAEKHFSARGMVSETEKLYESLLEGASR